MRDAPGIRVRFCWRSAVSRFVRASRDYAELEPVAREAAAVAAMRGELVELREMLADPEMKTMAAEDIARIECELPEAEQRLAIALLPRDSADARPAMLEIRAGTGGDEAALFAADLFRMYGRYAAEQGWKVETISVNASDIDLRYRKSPNRTVM